MNSLAISVGRLDKKTIKKDQYLAMVIVSFVLKGMICRYSGTAKWPNYCKMQQLIAKCNNFLQNATNYRRNPGRNCCEMHLSALLVALLPRNEINIWQWSLSPPSHTALYAIMAHTSLTINMIMGRVMIKIVWTRMVILMNIVTWGTSWHREEWCWRWE